MQTDVVMRGKAEPGAAAGSRFGLAAEEVRAALMQGSLAVVWQAVPDASVAAARLAARALHDRLTASLVPLRVRSSRSATAGWAGAAWAIGQPVGLDVERHDATLCVDAALRAAALCAAESRIDNPRAFIEAWVRKEAALKAAGVGLAVQPHSVCTGARRETWAAVALPADQTVWVRSMAAPAGCAAALATNGNHRRVTSWEISS